MGRQVRDLDARDEKGAMDAIDGGGFWKNSFDEGVVGAFDTWFADGGPPLGYCLSIDMTARNVQDEAKKKSLPWSIAKGFDTFLPIGDYIPKTSIPDPHDVELYLSVNGQVRQRDSTELMLFRIPRQLSDISKIMTLEKGDLVLTGTPKGVGPVDVGDVMKAGIRVGSRELDKGIEVAVEEKGGLYEFLET